MSTERMENKSTTSPWTETYAMYCQREESNARLSMADTHAEQEPTHHALADVYNRVTTEINSKRF